MNAEGQYLGLEGVYLIHPGSGATVYSDEFLQEGDAATLSLDVTHKTGALAVKVDFETRAPENTGFDVAATLNISSTGLLAKDVPLTKQICRLAFTFIGGSAKDFCYLVWSVGWRPEDAELAFDSAPSAPDRDESEDIAAMEFALRMGVSMSGCSRFWAEQHAIGIYGHSCGGGAKHNET